MERGNGFLSHKCLLLFSIVLLSGARRTKLGIVRTFRLPRSAYIRHCSTQSAVSVISTSYEGKDDEGVSFAETPVSKSETRFGPPKAGGISEKEIPGEPNASTPRTSLFFPILELRRPEQVCFSPSSSSDAPNKFVFPHPQAPTSRTSLFFPILELRRPEQVCFSPSSSSDAPNKFVFPHPRASTPRTSLFFPILELRRPEQKRKRGNRF